MRLIHTADLHLGKKVHGYSMLEDQAYILDQILNYIKDKKAQTLLISGDIYDKTMPQERAITLFDSFLTELSNMDIKVFIIPGNHDSADRISFGNKLISKSSIYIQGQYNSKIQGHIIEDDYGPLAIYMLPFIRPSNVRAYHPDINIQDYNEALSIVVDEMQIDKTIRNIILSHQFVTGASRTDSEVLSLGGTDNVSASIYKDFDYVALGHIHRPQKMTSEYIRYSGSPLKYSISEKNDKKSLVMVDLLEKGRVDLELLPLKPLHDLREIKGSYEELTLKNNYEGEKNDDYLHVILEDENNIANAMAKLNTIYSNILKLDYCNIRTNTESYIESLDYIEKRSEMELLEKFFLAQNGKELSKKQQDISKHIFKSIKEERIWFQLN